MSTPDSTPRALAMLIKAAGQLRHPVTRAEVRDGKVGRAARFCASCDRKLSPWTPVGYLDRVSRHGLCLSCIDAILAINAVRVPLVGRIEV